MFNRKLKKELKDEIYFLNEKIGSCNLNTKEARNEIDVKLEKFRIELDKFESNFRKEIIKEIAEKFFDTLEKIFRTNKEISLISALANQVNGKDMASLRSQLLQPFLDARWRDDKNKKGEEIINKGGKIIEYRQKLYDEILKKEREGEREEKLNLLRAKLETLDEVIGGLR